MTTADNKLRAIPRLVRDGKLRDALSLAGDVLDVASGDNASDLRRLSPDSMIVLRDLLDAARERIT
jgi:hypothetical protein